MPENVVIQDFLEQFRDWIEVIEIRENLKNYHFDWPKEIDQTRNFEDGICAQIDFIVRKKNVTLSKQWKRENNQKWFRDYWTVMFPIQAKTLIRPYIPKQLKTLIKRMRNNIRH